METRKAVPSELKKEIEDIFAVIKEIPEARDFGVKLISTLKSEFEGRGVPKKEMLEKLRKAFSAMVTSFRED